MKKYTFWLILMLTSPLFGKEMKDGIYTTLSKSNEVRMITVIDKKVRSVDVIIPNNDDTSRACWTDYGNFQIVTLTSKNRNNAYSFKYSNNEYRALTKAAKKHLKTARSFYLSAILYKTNLEESHSKTP